MVHGLRIYFLLEHHPLRSYLEAYQNKYGGNPALAIYALLYHKNIDHEAKVKLLKGKETDMEKINERLNKAVLNPSLEFGQRPDPPKKGRGFRR